MADGEYRGAAARPDVTDGIKAAIKEQKSRDRGDEWTQGHRGSGTDGLRWYHESTGKTRSKAEKFMVIRIDAGRE
jgi:hypothetical protein